MYKKIKNKLQLKSDALFKSIMTEQLPAREFLEEYLAPEVREILNLSDIKVEKESYVESQLRRQLSDIVYSIKTKDNKDTFVYCLLEHQTKSDYFIAFRLLKYTLLLCERHIKNKSKLPLVIPLVIYSGKDKYKAPRSFWELFEMPELAKEILASDYKLIDLQAMPDDEITKKHHLALFEYIMKHIHKRDIIKLWQDIFNLLSHAILLDKKQGYFYIRRFLCYTEAKVPEEKQEELNRLLIENFTKEEGEELVRTIAESYIEQGIERGIEQGIERGLETTAINMLKEKLDKQLICRVTGLSIDQLAKLNSKL